MEAGALGTPVLRARRNLKDRIGDPLLLGLSGLAAAVAVVLIGGIVYETIHLAGPAISKFGIGFVTTNDWNPVTKRFGAAPFLYGTVVTSAIALLFAAPLSIAISIYLTELAPGRLRRPVATLVDMLAAIPSVILGLWGILVLGPFMHDTIEPALKSVARLPADLRRRTVRLRLPDRRPDPHDHGHADHHQRHPRGLRDGAGRPQGGLLRARRDPLGDGPPGRAPLLAGRASSARRSSASAARSARRSRSPR